jgi:hypothetical protein
MLQVEQGEGMQRDWARIAAWLAVVETTNSERQRPRRLEAD